MTPKTTKKRQRIQKQHARHCLSPQLHMAGQNKRGAVKPSKSELKPPPGGFFIWGRHAVLAALANPKRRIAKLYATADSTKDLIRAMVKCNTNLPAPSLTERQILDSITSDGEKAVHQGMAAAVWPLDQPLLQEVLNSASKVPLRLVLLDQLSDPRNVGAIMRSACAFGVTAIIVTHRNAPEENGALARTAAGALEHVPLIRVVNLARTIKILQAAGITVAGLARDGLMGVQALSQFPRLAVIMGAEGRGLRRLTRNHCDHLVKIEINEEVDSLNVSNAAAIALHAAKPALE